jgi:hypothetical protein
MQPQKTNELDAAAKIDALKFIAQTHREIFAQRVARSYKLIVWVCTFYLLAIAGRYGTYGGKSVEQALVSPLVVALIWAVFLALSGFTAFILWRSLHADKMNQAIAQSAENAILDLVAHRQELLPKEKRNTNVNRYYLAWHAAFVFVLGVCSAALVTIRLP